MKGKKELFLGLSLAFLLSVSICAFGSSHNQYSAINDFAEDVYGETSVDVNSLENLKIEFDNAEITLPALGDDAITIMNHLDNADDFTFNLELTSHSNNVVLNDNKVFYQNTQEDYIHAVQMAEQEVRIITEILDADAPDEYIYNLDLPEGAVLEQNENGVIYIYDATGLIRALVFADAAQDADGNTLVTDIDIQDDGLVQVVQSDNDVAYPINTSISVMSVKTFAYYFTDGYWLTRSDGLTLELKPYYTNLYAATTLPNNVTRADDSWSTVYNKFYTHTNWKNTASMKSQYMCHYDLSVGTDAWNLEPWRTGTANATNLCNP